MSTDNYAQVRRHGFADILREHRRSRPDLLAAVDGAVRLTWRELDERVNRLANALRRRGLAPKDRILWLGQNSVHLFELLLAAAKIGVFVCPANWRLTPYETRWTISDFDPKLVVWQDAELGDFRQQLDPAEAASRPWIQHDGTGPDSWEALLAEGEDRDDDEPVDPELPLLGIYTAAFSGRPGSAMLAHTNLLIHALMSIHTMGIGEATRFLVSGPMFHLGVLMGAFATYAAGGAQVFVSRVDAQEMLDLIEQERITHAFITQPTIVQMKDLVKVRPYDLSSLFQGGDIGRWRFPQVIPEDAPMARQVGGFGQTELTGNSIYACFGGAGAGRPNPFAQVKILDDDGAEKPIGEPGEIAVRGPLVMLGYYNRPEENAARTRDGWHRTNDLGVRNADGSVSFIGPKTTMIKTGVENVYPAEVETCLKDHPAVAEACIIGVPDPKWDQNVKALIVLKAGRSCTSDELIDHCRQRMASYKKPKLVEFVDALPRLADGQIDRAAMDAAYGGGGYPSAGLRPRPSLQPAPEPVG